MPNIIPKKFSWLAALAFVAIPLFTWLFFSKTASLLLHDPEFSIPLGVLVGAFVYGLIHWLITLKDPAYEAKSARIFIPAVACAVLALWIGCWSAQYKTDKDAHINYEYKK